MNRKRRAIIASILCLCFVGLVLGSEIWAATTYALEFDPRAYVTEFFEGQTTIGSCGAAAVLLVESHIQLKGSISAKSLKTVNDDMVKNYGTYLPKGSNYYTSNITGIKNKINADKLYTATLFTPTNAETAKKNIFAALGRKHWVIIVARQGFNTKNDGHFYPVYGGKEDATIAKSSINAIEDFNTKYDPVIPNWNTMYLANQPLDKVLKSMASASSQKTPVYNILEVSKKSTK